LSLFYAEYSILKKLSIACLPTHYIVLDPGMAKFEAKTKTQSGIKLATTGQSNIESGKTFGSMELTYSCSDYGKN